jgi:hypothetical protein
MSNAIEIDWSETLKLAKNYFGTPDNFFISNPKDYPNVESYVRNSHWSYFVTVGQPNYFARFVLTEEDAKKLI